MFPTGLYRFLLISALFVALSACSPATAPLPAPIIIAPAPTEVLSQPTPAPVQATTESDAAPTQTSPPPQPVAPTATTAPTQTPLPSPTPLNPLMISVQRARTYPGSDIKIEQTLAPGANYNRYIASYLSDGLKIYALLTVPRGVKPSTGFPVIIFNHGFIPPNLYRTTERYVDYVDRIARSGYIVFKSDYRGHGSSEGEARGGYGAPDYTIDVMNAVGSMKKYPDADPNRIGMWGHSMGGYLTLRALVLDPTIKAASIWSGVVASYPEMLTRWHRPGSTGAESGIPTGIAPSTRRWRADLIQQYGTPDENPDFWNSISANSFLGDISAPVQLHHSTTDPEVPFEFSQLLYDQLTALDANVEFYKYQGDNHNLSNSFETAMQRTIQFFNKYVKGT